ncbi:PAS domain-containing protein [Hymenobacter sp. BT491]|uniref:PAS domain-containing protein n=1 Tax=Hymenobacter sp. BT491 TaxID=2766779 RepID=UPI001653D775|nr:PAS domain-containing protein [Hymenobacter sp. BT491]MBC6989415.1 PAS domain-containing protein [Hymenobacter sp. BT491]
MSDSGAPSTTLTSEMRALFPLDELLESLLNASLTGVALYRPIYGTESEIIDFEIVLLNPKAQKMLQLPARPTQTYLHLFPHTQATGVFEFHCQAYKSGEHACYSINYQGDGLDNYFHLSAKRVGDGLLVSFTDTAEHDRTAVEKALRESQARERAALALAESQRNHLEALLNQTPVAIGLFEGPERRISMANPKICAMWGRRPEEVLGKTLLEAMPELRGQGFDEALANVFRTEVPFAGTEAPAQMLRQGQLLTTYYNFVFQPLYDEQGRLLGVADVAVEVTEQVQARRQIEEKEKQLRTLNQELETANEDLVALNEELRVANDQNRLNIDELFRVQRALQQLNLELEGRVADRTHKLRQALQEAHVQRERFRSFLMQMPAPMCTFRGPEHVYELVNPAYLRTLGYRPLVGLPIKDALPELEGQGYFEMLDRVFQTGEPYYASESLVWLTDPNQEGALQEGFYNIACQATRDEHGVIDGIIQYALDVTEYVLARRKMEQNEERLQLALEAGSMATVDLDLLTNKTERSERHDHLFGYDTPLREWHNMDTLLEHMLPEDHARVMDQYDRSLTSGVLWLNPRIQLPNGEHRWMEAKGKVFYDAEGKPIRIAGVVTDVTERQQTQQRLQDLTEQLANTNDGLRVANAELALANEQLTHTNQELDNFVYTASHDLKQPINNMAGVFEELKRTATFHDPEAALLVQMFENSLSQIHGTIQGLAEVVQVERRNEDSAIENVELLPLTREVMQSMLDQAVATKARFEVNFSAVPVVRFVRLNLQSVLYNLLSNALKYAHSERAPVVRITSELSDEGAPVLVVQDNGLGLDLARYGPDLFQMFRRFHDHVPGSGVGLYLVNRMVRQVGGRIEVQSTLGEGTTFRIYLTTSTLPEH